MEHKNITVALDGTGGDLNCIDGCVRAVEFALTLYPSMRIMVFGPSLLKTSLQKIRGYQDRIDFVLAPMGIPQDEDPRAVLAGYAQSAMRLCLEAVKAGKADAVVSAGGTGPLVVLSRHILGTFGNVHPALCSRLPAGGNKRYTLMMDMGANARSSADDLYDFARLGSAAAKILLSNSAPHTAVLNIGTEEDKGNMQVRQARDLIKSDPRLLSDGFIEPNRIFCGDVDVIVTDGFTGNVALKAAEGVAGIFARRSFLKRILVRLSWPEWLIPWQYNGSLLLGVDGVVVKSHANAPDHALAVAMVEAARAVNSGLLEGMKKDKLLEKLDG